MCVYNKLIVGNSIKNAHVVIYLSRVLRLIAVINFHHQTNVECLWFNSQKNMITPSGVTFGSTDRVSAMTGCIGIAAQATTRHTVW